MRIMMIGNMLARHPPPHELGACRRWRKGIAENVRLALSVVAEHTHSFIRSISLLFVGEDMARRLSDGTESRSLFPPLVPPLLPLSPPQRFA